MNEEQKDKGLKRAVKAENEFRLPSNFAYRTMRKVEEAMRLREKKAEIPLAAPNRIFTGRLSFLFYTH